MTDPNRRSLLAGTAGALLGGGLIAAPSAAQNLVEGPDNWATMNRAERDAAYNNSAAVPEGAGMIDRWNAASADLRKQHKDTVDLPYGKGERNRWDLFPAKDSKAPCLVFVHGGYWQSRSRESFSCLTEGVREAGMSAALPGYTLAPDATLSQILAELISALDWLGKEGPAHGIEGPVIISGWSAGGHLAARLLAHPSVRAGLAISGIFELAPLRDTYLNDKLKLTDEEVAGLSPLRLPAIEKPLTLAYGTAELSPLVENSRVFHAFRAAQHAAGALIPVPKANHFTVLDALRPRDGVLARAAIDLAYGL
ncbi:alpha/beta hydrolase [Methylobacterium brachythecii]|uniref:Esterase n=1 Tax=Methylobacterium brachythecii TaxID=1176177 RepID=A0A7W6F5A8_9HYPH|nr:alpha/beta hydrolase [Methylobacterium brachythecii]MBB3901054.1 acetyl esterase/lipase [Methylobacterium brachythecii]GLS46632.1 esterase [Methylobacterium brachythecii]